MSPLCRTSSLTTEPNRASRQRGRVGLPSTMRVTFRRRAYVRTSAATSWPVTRHGLGAELLGQTERLDEAVPVRRRKLRLAGRLDGDDDPLGVQPGGHPAGGPNDPGRQGARADADEDALGHRPDSRHGVVAPIDLHLGVDACRGRPQRELPERDQVALAEEAAHRLARPARGRRPCPPADAGSGRRGEGRPARPRPPPRGSSPGPSRASATSVTCATTSFRLSRCWTFSVV